jgi:hypothetical protein
MTELLSLATRVRFLRCLQLPSAFIRFQRINLTALPFGSILLLGDQTPRAHVRASPLTSGSRSMQFQPQQPSSVRFLDSNRPRLGKRTLESSPGSAPKRRKSENRRVHNKPNFSHARSIDSLGRIREISEGPLRSIVPIRTHLCTESPFQPRLPYAILAAGLLNASALPESNRERPS